MTRRVRAGLAASFLVVLVGVFVGPCEVRRDDPQLCHDDCGVRDDSKVCVADPGSPEGVACYIK